MQKRMIEQGYFSVEAALIMPIVLYSLIFVIYIGFFQYNRCLLLQDSYRMLLRGEQIKKDNNDEVCAELKRQDARWYYDKYMLSNFGGKTIEVSYNQIRIAQEMSINIPFSMLQDWTKGKQWKTDIDIAVSRMRPVETIRNCRKVEALLDKVK